MPERNRLTVTLWTKNGLSVWARFDETGDLRIDGQDLKNAPGGMDEYEYFLTVPKDQVPRITAALNAPEDANVLDLLVQHAEQIVTKGERSWLKSIGIEPGFFSMLR